MRPLIEKLYELQSLLLPVASKEAAALERVRQLRATSPAPFLAHFDRLVTHGRRAVAVVRNGVCGECHMRLASGAAVNLAGGEEVVLEQRRRRDEARARWIQKSAKAKLASV
jgi:mono/diheme cytochrome c family protein